MTPLPASTMTVRRDKRRAPSVGTVARHVILTIVSIAWAVPLFVVVLNAFKSQSDILDAPFGIPLQRLSFQYVIAAVVNPDFNVIGSYGFTILLVILGNIIVIGLCGPVSYWIARGLKRRHQALLFYFLLGTFIPAQAILIPVTSVLRTVHLMDTFWGLVAFQSVMAVPVTVFLFVAYIRSIPQSLDEAAMIDGAGLVRRFWSIIFPLMRPIVATAVILNSMGIWNDFVNPQIILGPLGAKTVTTGVYAAFGQYVSDYTVIFPDLLLVLAPILVFFVVMQRHIVNGLTTGAVK